MEGILLIILTAILIGFGLIFLLALSDKKRKTQDPTKNEGPEFSQLEFEKACVALVEGMKLEVDEITRSAENRLDIMARNPTPFTGGQLLVHCVYSEPDSLIEAPDIIELSNMVIQERLSKGIFITTGRFTKDIPAIGELAPLEFIDGRSLRGLLEKYRMV